MERSKIILVGFYHQQFQGMICLKMVFDFHGEVFHVFWCAFETIELKWLWRQGIYTWTFKGVPIKRLRDGDLTPFRNHLAPLWGCWYSWYSWLSLFCEEDNNLNEVYYDMFSNLPSASCLFFIMQWDSKHRLCIQIAVVVKWVQYVSKMFDSQSLNHNWFHRIGMPWKSTTIQKIVVSFGHFGWL